MVGQTDYLARHVLDFTTGKAAMPSLVTPCFIGLFTAVGTDAGTGFTEPSTNAYARASVAAGSWNSASGSAPATTSNSGAITFPQATNTGWGTIIAFGIFDAATLGNLLEWDYLGAFSWLPFSCSLASPGVLTSPAHGYANGDPVVVTNEFGGTLPATAGSWAGVLTVAGATTDTFTAGVNTTGTGNGMVRKIIQQPIAGNVTPSFAGGTPGQLVLTQA